MSGWWSPSGFRVARQFYLNPSCYLDDCIVGQEFCCDAIDDKLPQESFSVFHRWQLENSPPPRSCLLLVPKWPYLKMPFWRYGDVVHHFGGKQWVIFACHLQPSYVCLLAKACFARQVVTLLRWRIVELYYREVDELLYELSNLPPTATFVLHRLPDCWLPAVLHCFGNSCFECRLGVVIPIDTCIAIVRSYHTSILQDGSIYVQLKLSSGQNACI